MGGQNKFSQTIAPRGQLNQIGPTYLFTLQMRYLYLFTEKRQLIEKLVMFVKNISDISFRVRSGGMTMSGLQLKDLQELILVPLSCAQKYQKSENSFHRRNFEDMNGIKRPFFVHCHQTQWTCKGDKPLYFSKSL